MFIRKAVRTDNRNYNRKGCASGADPQQDIKQAA